MVLSSPGVEVNIRDFSDYTSSPSTCIAGIIGTGAKGPVSALVTSVDQFIRTFGKPDGKAYGPYAAIEFLKQGNQLYYHRILKQGVRAKAGIDGTDKLSISAIEEGEEFNGITVELLNEVSDETLTLTIKKAGQEQEKFEKLSMNPDSVDYVPKKINGISNFITVQILPTGSFPDKTFTLEGGRSGASRATSTPLGETKVNPPVFTSKTVDITINEGVVTLTEPDNLGYCDYTLTNRKGEAVERFAGVNIVDRTDPRYLDVVLQDYSDYLEVVIPSTASDLAGEYTLAGSYDGSNELVPEDYISANGPIEAFSNSNTFPIDILAIPGVSDASVVHAAVGMCETRQDVIFITDVPFGMSTQEVVNWANASGSWSGRHAPFDSYLQAIYGPWGKMADTYNNGVRIDVPPSVMVLPRYAYSDRTGGVGVSPAGIDRGKITNIVSLERQLTQGDSDAWYGGRNVINPIMNFGVSGIVINGQKTTQRKSTALDRINVVRVINYIRKQVYQISLGFLFESNHPVTYQRWVTAVDPMLDALKNAGTISDYQIKMDETTVTDYDRDNSRLPGSIAIKPTKLSEFIDISLRVDNQSTVYIDE